MAQVKKSSEVQDVIVIGSGAAGGTVAQVLTAKGIKVTLLEAGPMLDPAKEFKEHMWPYDVDHRGAGEGGAFYFGRESPSAISRRQAADGNWRENLTQSLKAANSSGFARAL